MGVEEENRENLSGKENVADRHTDIIVSMLYVTDSFQNLLLILSLRAKNTQILQPLESLTWLICYFNVANMGDHLANQGAVDTIAHMGVGVGEGQVIVVNASQQSDGCT